MKTKKSLPPKNFEAALGELEALSTRIESGALPLEEVLSFYQRGVILVNYCRKKLDEARAQIRLLDKEGLVITDNDDE